MKVRQGFVSNSSSSSFIIGYGIIKDEEKLRKFLTKNNLKLGWDVKILNNGIYSGDDFPADTTLHGGNNTDLEIPAEIFSTKTLFVVDIGNNEGDGDFWNEETEDLEYEKAEDINFYNEEQQKIIGIFSNKELIEDGVVQIGAERNG